MAQISVGESKWRMLRRVVGKKRFAYADARNMTRDDRAYFAWLVAEGFVAAVGADQYELTDKGKAAAELGFYEV